MKLMECCGVPPARCVQIAAAGDARRQLAEQARLAAQKAAHVVAIAAVPLGPAEAGKRPT